MSPLTKALVVLNSMLAVLLVALSASYIANQENLQEDLDKAESQLRQTSAIASTAGRADEAQIESLQQAAAALEQTRRDNEAALIAKDKQIADLGRERAAAVNEAQGLKTTVGSLLSGGTAKDSRIDNLQTSLSDTESLLAERNQRVQELSLENGTLDQANTLLRDRIDRMDEQLFGMTQALEDARSGATAVADAGTGENVAPAAPGGPVIRGQVVGVRDVGGGLRFLQINIGSEDSVSDGDRFFVYRGREYLGTLTINGEPEVAIAVGRVEGQKSGQITVGDLVQSGI
ncbi:MAG: hypothetical protein AAGA57_04295 [Planctomycetota bacterium]